MKAIILLTLTIFLNFLSFSQEDTILYSFFVAGHTYGAPGVNNVGFHPPFKQRFGYIQSRPEIKFGVLTGDIVSPNPTAQDWDEIDADIDTLELPVYFAVGNHDMENRELYESRYGDTYYYFKYKNDLFIILDPNLDGWNISGDQLQFLKDVVNENASQCDNIFVFFHQILWRESDNPFNYIHWNSDAGRADTINFWSEVEPIFRELTNNVFMFAGDLGASWASNVTYDHYDNITLIATGMGDGEGDNFIVVNVMANKDVEYDLICLGDTDLFCMGDLTDYLVVSDLSSETNQQRNSSNFSISPNPAQDFITITKDETGNALVKIFNMQGIQVLKDNFNAEKIKTINISNFTPGMYYLKINNNRPYNCLKFIKQ